MDTEVRAVLEELLELGRLEQRDGQLSAALKARREELEDKAADAFERVRIPAKDLRATVDRLMDRDRLLPGIYGGFGGAFSRQSMLASILIRLIAGIAVGLAGAVGPLTGESLTSHWSQLLSGPLPYSLASWGFIYPAALARWEYSDVASRVGFPKLEESLVLVGILMLGGWLTMIGAPVGLWAASGLLWGGVALASISIVRSVATARLVSRLATRLMSSGTRALAQWNPASARTQFELALALRAAKVKNDELLAYLRVAILLEAEELRTRHYRLQGRSLLWSRGIEPTSSDGVEAVHAWSLRAGTDRAELLEASGLYFDAAEVYRATHRPKAAKRCYQTAVLTAADDEVRKQAYLSSLGLDGMVDQVFLGRLLDQVESSGTSATQIVRLLSDLPSHIIESQFFLTELGLRIGRQAGGQGVSILESMVGMHAPPERPGLYSLLSDAYYRIGHRGTARRIRSELGTQYTRWSGQSDTLEPPATPNTSDLAAALSERYRLKSRLGFGSMGAVYLAEDVVLERPVALKVLNPKLMTDIFVEKFRAEARVVARLDHPNIVRIFDAGQTDHWLYFVMEFVDGPDLGTLIGRAENGPPLCQRLAWAVQIAEAMAYAHSQGVIHRDLKPANVLIHPGGQARVTDFGVARVIDTSPHATAFSQAGLQVGTPSFMAPEQLAKGNDASVLTDVYALGTILYYMVTSQLPFEEDPLLRLDSSAPAVRDIVPSASAELAELIHHALEPDPERRLYGMMPFAERLRGCPELVGSLA